MSVSSFILALTQRLLAPVLERFFLFLLKTFEIHSLFQLWYIVNKFSLGIDYGPQSMSEMEVGNYFQFLYGMICK